MCSREQALFCIAFNLNPVVVSRNQVGDYFVIAKIIRVVNVLVVYTAQFSPAAAIPILKCQFCEAEFFDIVGGFKVDSNAGSIWTVTAESYVVPCEQIGGLRINAFVKKEQIGFMWGCGCNSGRNRPGFGGCLICRQSIACKNIAKQQNRCKKQGDEFFHCY